MKALRKLSAATLLTCVLAVSVSAGEIWLGYTPPPPPPDPQPASAVASDETGETGDVLTDVIGTLLNGVLSVF